MPHALVTVELDPASGYRNEAAVNTFAFISAAPLGSAVRLDILNAVENFYTSSSAPQTLSIGSYLSSILDRGVGACRMKLYDISNHLDGSPHGSPIEEGQITLPAPQSTENLPHQVACCLTLRARNALTVPQEQPPGVRNRKRLSGRLYIGPLNQAADAHFGNGPSRPIAAFQTNLMAAAEKLQDNLVDGDYAWGVWSRASEMVVPIVRAEVDDSWDVLRSRKYHNATRQARNFAPVPALVLGS